ncbi:fimbrial biogenesis chaperone [Erwinia tasmaniensis]|uniref:Pili assembly chaperone n=1 Tax=Erwinia tasmaniensis (strain DSM 17950 / CFBP 7177 / CIP 109463 / NCPPB 4357 / Et1/99) TaxID=465817 RepID=B2VGN0_ERWT9|nr:molecular chaperone [Erwinia tasmaniensis]CAO95432.1 Pili assembly chaperone precursor [Erwinia tasmaniensis Et1/99]
MKFVTYLKIFSVYFFLISGVTHAAVVMNASRIVMEDTTEKTIIFDNTSENPFIVQVEADNKEKPDFIAVPPVFKIKEKGGQTVKVKLLSSQLPQDKESLFYLNFTQIPGVRKDENGDDRLNIIIRSRLKIIYRPASVNAFSAKDENKISYRLQSGTLVISNKSPNILSIREISNGKRILAEQVTLLPGENHSTVLKDNHLSGPLNAVIINDYGTPVNFLITDK